ncbi:S1 family peptidase [Fodinibius sediminis]|uniref:Trypsin-like peptidase domain-containing protein n=1 Tax=Fodinibius sediminis TaxID=1214077 RepID=A0A521D4W3_9BACT|nr:serine protease [Fodinibius sediminis]SMO66728.1 Trypsin-like peptidase domain-containing protein [Fodinibius sediminis]
MDKYVAFTSFFFLTLWVTSCSVPQESSVSAARTGQPDTYTTAFPHRDISDQLEDAQESLIRIVSTSHYNTYVFDKPEVRLSDVRTSNLKEIASQQYSDDESTAGTSIILDLNDNGEALLITCAHSVTSPDTLINYFIDEGYEQNTYIESISIKRRQTNLLFTVSELTNFEIIAEDRLSDLALLSTTLNPDTQSQHRALRFPMGQMEHLRLGSFLYVLGYPKGFPMITRGIASTRGNPPHRFFIMDALFNPGISGGLVIGSRDHFRSFEWLGMARSATASQETVLLPYPDSEEDVQAGVIRPYTDQIFLGQKNRIAYGITQAIPISEIRSFLDKNSRVISRHRFAL